VTRPGAASITATAVNNIGAASSDVRAALANVDMPEGATWELAGATEMTGEVFRSLGIAMLVAILLVYIIMVATFRSLMNPIMLVSIPFAAVGAILALSSPAPASHAEPVGLLMPHRGPTPSCSSTSSAVPARAWTPTAVIEGGRRRLRPLILDGVARSSRSPRWRSGIGGEEFSDAARGGRDRRPLHLDVLTLIPVPCCTWRSTAWPARAEDDGTVGGADAGPAEDGGAARRY
jgi:HAE1 family hydrophobic/amphiphilic exporter-1